MSLVFSRSLGIFRDEVHDQGSSKTVHVVPGWVRMYTPVDNSVPCAGLQLAVGVFGVAMFPIVSLSFTSL